MFEQYLELLDTFRRKKFSVLVGTINTSLEEKLTGPKWSPRLQAYLLNKNRTGQPYTNFSHEPAQVTQVKKIFNALYYAKLAMIDLEEVNLRSTDQLQRAIDLNRLYSKTVHSIYQASFYATHLDIDLRDIFSQEIAALAPMLTVFETYAKTHKEGPKEFLSQIQEYDIPHKVGVISGIVVDQLQPRSGTVDYEFLTQFTAVIPAYLDELSLYIQKFSKQVSEKEPNLDKETLEALENDALQLLHSIQSLQGGSFMLPLKLLQYVRIIKRTVTLSLTIVDQVKNVGDSTQDLVKENLAQLKYDVLPTLFGFIDKVEEQAMVKPGTIADPVLGHVNNLYQQLITYAEKAVDFHEKGRELLTIEDSKFITKRLDHTYQRKVEHAEKMMRLEEARNASQKFFAILAKDIYRGTRLVDLPATTKEILISHYKLMQPFAARINPELSNQIIGGLTRQKGRFEFSFSSYPDRIDTILEFQTPWIDYLKKQETSINFHHSLNNDISISVQLQRKDLRLFPCTETKTLSTNEADAFTTPYEQLKFENVEGSSLITNPEKLTLDQAWDLHRFYALKKEKFEAAKQAYIKFLKLLKTEGAPVFLAQFDEEKLNTLKNLYGAFQPYLIGLSQQSNISVLDKILVSTLMKEMIEQPVMISRVVQKLEPFQSEFAGFEKRLDENCAKYTKLITEITYKQNKDKPFETDSHPERANHAVKHKEYSKAVTRLRSSLTEFIPLFNHSIRSQLNPASSGVPYPELVNVYVGLTQANPVLSLKRFYNAIYYLEQITFSLEDLHDHSYESTYVLKIIEATAHLKDAFDMATALYTDPHFTMLADELLQGLRTVYDAAQTAQDIYFPDSPKEKPQISPSEADPSLINSGKTKTEPEKKKPGAGLSYALNILRILPEQIKAFRKGEAVDPIAISEMQISSKVAADNINRIIGESNSYFRLFMEIPTMFGLFRKLKNQLKDLTTQSHDVVLENLENIRSEIITQMLLEADLWEDRLGLVPGSLSTTLKSVLDEFYQGLLEPLGLPSKTHIELVSSLQPTHDRIEAVQKRIEKSLAKDPILEEDLEILESFNKKIRAFREFATSDKAEAFKRPLIELYVLVAPILKKAREYTDIDDFPYNRGSEILDAVLHPTVDASLRFKDIETLTRAAISKFKGEAATERLARQTAAEKITFLQKVNEKQFELNSNFVDNYCKRTFKKKVAALTSSQFGLIHCGREYKEQLIAFLQTKQDQIIQRSKSADDIGKRIGDEVRKKIERFEKERYKQYFHLENLKAAIATLQLYVHDSNIEIQSNSSTFESETTLAPKSILVSQLEEYANDPALSVAQRIEKISQAVKNPSFETKILTYHHYNRFTFAWLRQCVLSFFELLHLYTSGRQKSYNQFVEAVKEPAEISKLSARFGLFSDRGYGLPLRDAAEDEPDIAPTA